MSGSNIDQWTAVMAGKGRALQRDLWQILVAGTALTIPLFISLLVLAWAIDFVLNALEPVVSILIAAGFVKGTSTVLVKLLGAGVIFGLIFVVGLAARHGPETHLAHRIDNLMEDIPGIGSIYSGVERLSAVLLEGDADSFQEVKLVEFLGEDTFAIAFVTAEAPPKIEEAVHEEGYVTVFVPLAPNPVMGGHLLTVPEERLYEVDLSVEEGIQAIMTTGITIDPHAQNAVI